MGPTRQIHLPLMQRYDCHGCGYCCSSLVVNVSDAERRRIIAAGWESRVASPPFVKYRFRGRTLHRLAHGANGRCVFLDDDGRCRLHAESGTQLKPFACRLYPFVPTPSPTGMRIDMRGDCPSVAGNQGRQLAVHQGEVAAMVAESGIPGIMPAPLWTGEAVLSADEFEAVAEGFLWVLNQKRLGFRERLRRGCRLLDMLYGTRVAKVREERFRELIDMLVASVLDDADQEEVDGAGADAAMQPYADSGVEQVSCLRPRAQRLWRQWLFLHGIADDPADLSRGWFARMGSSWRRYLQSRRFVYWRGPVPQLGPDWPATTFEATSMVGRAPDQALEPLVRIMQVKLDARSFAGAGYFGADLLGGLTSLWLLPGIVGWFARLTAIGGGRAAMTPGDVVTGVRLASHTFGVSPVFARISERLRLRALSRVGVARAVLAEYGP